MSETLSKKCLVFQTPEELDIALKQVAVGLSAGDPEQGMNVINIVKALMVSYHGLKGLGVELPDYRLMSDNNEEEKEVTAQIRDNWRGATRSFCDKMGLTFNKEWFKNE